MPNIADVDHPKRNEIVYSDDGLPALSLHPVPIHVTPTCSNNADEIEDILDTSSYDPVQAFDVFQGKVFNHSKSTTSYLENPIQKLSRLRSEVEDLEHDVMVLNKKDYNMMTDDNNGNPVMGIEMENQIAILTERLNNLKSNIDVEGMYRREQLCLTERVHSEVAKISMISSSTSTTSEEEADNKEKGVLPKLGIVYELYSDPKDKRRMKVVHDDYYSNWDLETRLDRIETLIGRTSGVRTISLLERLKMTEKKLAILDEKALHVLSIKAKVIRVDLEAASKAKAKLSTITNVEDTQAIAQLHQQLLDLDGFVSTSSSSHAASDIMTTITQRLSNCAELHVRASIFGSDLTRLEHKARDTERLLKSVEETVDTLKSGMNTNMELIERNMALLDKRMKEVGMHSKTKSEK